MQPAICAKNLGVEFDHDFKALDNVSLELPSGKVIGCIGPSGAGKTTFIRCVVGRRKLSAGSLDIFGIPAGSAKLRSQISYMTQELSIYPDLTVRQNLQYFCRMYGVKRKELGGQIAKLLDKVQLEPQKNQVASSLSGGQKQRLSLAVALIGQPKLLVLDEPTVGLDPLLRDQIWQLFRELAASGSTLLISSHVMDEAERCDDLVLIREGQILAHGTPAELRQKTAAETVEQAFLKLVEAA